MAFVMRTSIHGRRLGLTSTGGIISGQKSTGGNSTAFGMAAQMWGSEMAVSVASDTASTLSNFGFTKLASGTATAISFEVARPELGVEKRINIATSASEATLGSTSTAIIFKPAVAGAGSSMFFSAANLAGTTITMVGVSSAEWAHVGSTVAMTIG